MSPPRKFPDQALIMRYNLSSIFTVILPYLIRRSITNSTEQTSSPDAMSLSWSRNSPPLMESEGSSPCSQQPVSHSLMVSDLITLSSNLRLYFHVDPDQRFQNGLFPSNVRNKTFHGFLVYSIRAICPTNLTSPGRKA
jgi:hypothetical protein